MKIRPVSDIHTEFFGEDEISAASEVILPPLPDDDETVLVLAGDIGSIRYKNHLLLFMEAVAPRFKEVLYIPGNHEYYGGDFVKTPHAIIDLLRHIENVKFFESFQHRIREDEKYFIHLMTLWTDFDDKNPQSMIEAQMRMNDYRMISIGDRILTPEDTLARHIKHRVNIRCSVLAGDVVVTHHSPCMRSVPAEYIADRVNGAYHSDLTKEISQRKPKLWIHGHTHTACDYMQGDTRILCNPRGYGNQYKKNGYRPTLVAEI